MSRTFTDIQQSLRKIDLTSGAEYVSRVINRRDLLRRSAGVGIGVASLAALGKVAAAAGVRSNAGVRARFQEGSPVPAATPAVGAQPDGSTIWRVKVGDMDMAILTELHAFLPGELTINEGDSVWFDMSMPGFHTVSFLSGADVPPLMTPDPEAATPAAGEMPRLVYNPAMLQQTGLVYDGTGFLNSGPDFMRDPSQPFVVKFTKAGSYDYLCIPHAAVMRAKIIVQPAGSSLPLDQAAVDARAAEEMAALYDAVKADREKYSVATQTMRDDGTSLWEATVGAGGESKARVQAFLPAELDIKVGDTVTWVHRAPGEPHTVTFVGSDAKQPEDVSFEAFVDGSPKIVQSMETFLPQGGDVFSGTGYVNSGFIGIPQIGLPMEWSCTFDTPGQYIYYCILHGDGSGQGMAAKLNVS